MADAAQTRWTDSIDPSVYGASGKRIVGLTVNPVVFFVASTITLAAIIATIVGGKDSAAFLEWLRAAVVANFDGFLMMSGNLFLLFCGALILSPLGSIRLGGAGERPRYSTVAWFSMLFGAGMGIGLIFYGVSEPVTHFVSSVAADAGTAASWAPLGGAAGDPAAARDIAMAASIFNWSLHPWAIYAVVGLALAVFAYNFDMPLSMRSAFYPIFGKAVWGKLGDVIDILAVFATLGGLATSLGLGAEQAMVGITHLYGVAATPGAKIALVGVMAAFTALSVAGGIEKGIRYMSEINLVLALLLVIFILIFGPTLLLLKELVVNTAQYVVQLPALSNPFGRTDTNFYDNWTVYYWAWWISWAPFVGMFMARISRGRTVREFLLGALLAPTLLSIIWMTVFGGTAIDQIASGSGRAIVDAALETKLFLMLEGLPWSSITSFLGIILVLIFFITGWDSGTLVIDCMTSAGRTDTPLGQRLFWLLTVGAVAVTLLLTGGLIALQAAAITTGLPLAALMLLMCVGTYRGLQVIRKRAGQPAAPVLPSHAHSGTSESAKSG